MHGQKVRKSSPGFAAHYRAGTEALRWPCWANISPAFARLTLVYSVAGAPAEVAISTATQCLHCFRHLLGSAAATPGSVENCASSAELPAAAHFLP